MEPVVTQNMGSYFMSILKGNGDPFFVSKREHQVINTIFQNSSSIKLDDQVFDVIWLLDDF